VASKVEHDLAIMPVCRLCAGTHRMWLTSGIAVHELSNASSLFARVS